MAAQGSVTTAGLAAGETLATANSAAAGEWSSTKIFNCFIYYHLNTCNYF